ncbi:MAG: acetylxylan esterase [Gemmatimonadota bacterium]|nr:acetylxylan esterase [Gemmatimonadota bacterium]
MRKHFRKEIFFLVLVSLCLLWPWAAGVQAQALRVYRSGADSRLASEMLYKHLTSIAWKMLDERSATIRAITTADQVVARQQEILEKMLSMLGPLPERTTLKAQVTGTFEREGYRVEKVVYQSRPGFYVTATLYLPTGRGEGPFPAVLGPCGHSHNGKAATVYQMVYAGLARLGCVVLTYDPPGQGERSMYYNEELNESMFGSTTEHTMAGIQCLLTGSNAATYFIWDGMRGIDYLISRPEVDPKRIGITGNSGGGTLSAYIAALDSRVTAAVPSCYITSWRRLWESIGPQDAEQNLLPFIGSGLDFSDYIIAFAPKPYLINSAIQDFFPIRGTRETYAEAKHIYKLLGAGDKLELFEADDGHGYTKPRRESAYRWLGTHLLGLSGPWSEKPMLAEPDENLQVTPTGQVCTSYKDTETIGSINAAYARTIMPEAPQVTSRENYEKFRDGLLAEVRNLARCERVLNPLNVQSRGFATRPGMKIELLTFDCEPGITLPALLFSPEEQLPAGLPVILYVSSGNKADDAETDIRSLVEKGHTVFAPDLRGWGETARESTKPGAFATWFSRDYDIPMMAFQVNRSLVGMRTLDLMRAVDVITSLSSGRGQSPVVAIAKGMATVPLLHAAALDYRIVSVILDQGLVSWKSVVGSKYHRDQLENVVLGALNAYDLPALAAALAPRPLVLDNLSDPLGHPLAISEVADRYTLATECYGLLGKPENFLITSRQKGLSLAEAYANILTRY